MEATIRANAQTKKVLISVGKLSHNSKRAVELGMKQLGQNLVSTAQNSVTNEPKFGRWYPSGSITKLPRDNHRASAAGQTPALGKGRYFSGIKYLQRGNEISFGVDASVPYAAFLEDGARGPGKRRMEKRPGLRNSINSNARNFRQYINIALEKQLQQ